MERWQQDGGAAVVAAVRQLGLWSAFRKSEAGSSSSGVGYGFGGRTCSGVGTVLMKPQGPAMLGREWVGEGSDGPDGGGGPGRFPAFPAFVR